MRTNSGPEPGTTTGLRGFRRFNYSRWQDLVRAASSLHMSIVALKKRIPHYPLNFSPLVISPSLFHCFPAAVSPTPPDVSTPVVQLHPNLRSKPLPHSRHHPPHHLAAGCELARVSASSTSSTPANRCVICIITAL